MTIRVMLTEVLMSTMHLKSLPVAVCWFVSIVVFFQFKGFLHEPESFFHTLMFLSAELKM
jgi:hypothetical protein